jgi:hypothetical protein
MKDWAVYLEYPRPTTVKIDRAIELAELHLKITMNACFDNGGCDGDYSGQMRGVDDDEKEVKHLKAMKRRGVERVRT